MKRDENFMPVFRDRGEVSELSGLFESIADKTWFAVDNKNAFTVMA